MTNLEHKGLREGKQGGEGEGKQGKIEGKRREEKGRESREGRGEEWKCGERGRGVGSRNYKKEGKGKKCTE